MKRFGLIAALTFLAATETMAAPPPCDGHYAYLRTSTILPGKMPLFEKAVSDQGSWYAAHGNGTKAQLIRIIRRDPASGTFAYAEDQAMTLTIHPGGGTRPPAPDASWEAFTAEFRESSVMKDESFVCLPDR